LKEKWVEGGSLNNDINPRSRPTCFVLRRKIFSERASPKQPFLREKYPRKFFLVKPVCKREWEKKDNFLKNKFLFLQHNGAPKCGCMFLWLVNLVLNFVKASCLLSWEQLIPF
jgi:hypothetical protein